MKTYKTKIAILGTGPGSIYSFFGALQAGYLPEEVCIFGGEPSWPTGAFWLHDVPVALPSEQLWCSLLGTSMEYSRKQWGEPFQNSAGKYAHGKSTEVWNPATCIPALWQLCNTMELNGKLTAEDIASIAETHDYVIQTFPTDPDVIQIMKQYRFPVYTKEVIGPKKNICIYNGNKSDQWVRMTEAFGRVCVEYPPATEPQDILDDWEQIYGVGGRLTVMPDMHPLQKPIADRVYGKRRNIFLTGRWATLDRAMLSHDSQFQVFNFLEGRR